MLEIEDYALPFGLCFSRPIMLKIMLAYCINAYLRDGDPYSVLILIPGCTLHATLQRNVRFG